MATFVRKDTGELLEAIPGLAVFDADRELAADIIRAELRTLLEQIAAKREELRLVYR